MKDDSSVCLGVIRALRGDAVECRQDLERASAHEVELSGPLSNAHDRLLRHNQERQTAFSAPRPTRAGPVLSPSPGAPSKVQLYWQLVGRIQEKAKAILPPEATVIVVSKGDPDLLQIGVRRAWHFPQNEKGIYAGYYPRDGLAAISHLESLRREGGNFLLFPATAFWWLNYYTELSHHLEAHYCEVLRDDSCVIFDLRETRVARTGLGLTEPGAKASRPKGAATNDEHHHGEGNGSKLRFIGRVLRRIGGLHGKEGTRPVGRRDARTEEADKANGRSGNGESREAGTFDPPDA